MKTLLLLSGGMDSSLCLKEHCDIVYETIGFDYGQPHAIELNYAAKLAMEYGKPFRKVVLPFIPRVNTLVFAGRNSVLLSHAVSFAQANGLDSVMIGCNKDDEECFPDCRQPFLEALGSAFYSGYGVKLLYPLLNSTKKQIKERSLGMETWTCYSPTPDNKQCNQCYSCKGLLK